MVKSKKILPSENSDEGFLLSDVLILIASNIQTIITPPIICILFAFIYLFIFANPIFTSKSKIMSSSSSSGGNLSQAVGIAAQFGINIPNNQGQPKWVYKDIITSRSIANKVIKKQFDTKKFGKNVPLIKMLTHKDKELQLKKDTLKIVAVDKFLKMISVSEDMKTGILTIKVDAFEPRLAAQINDVIIEELEEHQYSYNKRKASKTRKFIEERIFSTKKELESAEEDLKNFNDRNRRIENSPGLQLEQQRLFREVTVLTGVFTTLKQQLETTKIEEVKDSDYVIIIDDPNIPLNKSAPKKRLTIFLSIIFGLGVGIILTFANELYTKSEKNKIKKAKSIAYKNLRLFIPRFMNYKSR